MKMRDQENFMKLSSPISIAHLCPHPSEGGQDRAPSLVVSDKLVPSPSKVMRSKAHLIGLRIHDRNKFLEHPASPFATLECLLNVVTSRGGRLWSPKMKILMV